MGACLSVHIELEKEYVHLDMWGVQTLKDA